MFADAADAVAAAVDIQRELSPDVAGIGELQVRIGLNTGTCRLTNGDVLGRPPNLAARLQSAGHGGQILLSGTTATLLRRACARRSVVRSRSVPHAGVRRAGRCPHGRG